MEEFSIGVGNTSNVSMHTECAYQAETVGAGEDVSLSCSAVARYVSLRREGGRDIDHVSICEFVVTGYPLISDGIYLN